MRRCVLRRVAPWVPPPRHDVFVTMPPPPGGEVGGLYGVSTGYSERLATTPYWKRMALSTYELRMRENATRYPMSPYREGEYDLRYTITPYPDRITHRPLLEIGEARNIPRLRVPVIFLVNLYNSEEGTWWGKKYDTVYVDRDVARNELLPQRYAIYATPEAYAVLGLPVVRHHIHETIPKSEHEYKKVLEKQSYEEERWKYTIEYLFRRYARGPPELLDDDDDGSGAATGALDGLEEAAAVAEGALAGGDGAAGAAARKGPVKQRKARKVKLY